MSLLYKKKIQMFQSGHLFRAPTEAAPLFPKLNQVIDDSHNWIEGIVQENIVAPLTQRIHRTVAPGGYSTDTATILKQLVNVISNDSTQKDSFAKTDNEIFGYSLGQLGKDNMENWEQSPYYPNNEKTDEVFMRLKHNKEFNPNFMYGVMSKLLNNEDRGKGVLVESGQYYRESDNYYDPIQRHNVYMDKDDNGSFISMIDKFDLANDLANSMLQKKPRLYDRFYYDEKPLEDMHFSDRRFNEMIQEEAQEGALAPKEGHGYIFRDNVEKTRYNMSLETGEHINTFTEDARLVGKALKKKRDSHR